MEKLINRYGKYLASLALLITVLNINIALLKQREGLESIMVSQMVLSGMLGWLNYF